MNRRKNSEFFELLLLNNNLKLRNWLASKGKSAKVTCPVMFQKREKGEDKNGKI